MKSKLKIFFPPIVLSFIRYLLNLKYGWKGNYNSWDDAESISTGYDQVVVLEKVRKSLLAVKNGDAIYERDSVLFNEIQYNWPLLSALMLSSSRNNGLLSVMDFGGSLGSSYFQNSKFIEHLHVESKWGIVEQRHFVDVGKKDFENDQLKFFYDIKTCIDELKPNVLLLSSVLQYIEKPFSLLNEILKHRFDFIIIDRTPFTLNNEEVIKVQYVHPSIYNASYPCWFFSKNKLCNFFDSYGYELIEEFDALDGFGNDYSFHGLILKIKKV